MKRLLIVLIFTGTILSTVNAQLTIGVKAGYNTSKFKDHEMIVKVDKEDEIVINVDYKYKPGFHIGGLLNYQLNNLFDIQTELLYSMQGYKENIGLTDVGGTTYDNLELKVTTHYINIPLLLKIKGYKRGMSGFFLEAGPQVGIYLSNKDVSDIEDVEYLMPVKGFRPFSLAVAGGIGYHHKSGISLSARYTQDLTETNKNIKKSRNQAFLFSLAYDIKTF